MKIAIVRRYYSLRKGGAERYCVTLSRQLRALGHDVTFVGEGIDEPLKDEIPFIPVRVRHATSWTKNQSFAENAAKAVGRAKFDIVYGLGRSFGVDVFRVTERLQSHWLNVYYKNRIHRSFQRLNPRHRTIIDLERTICRTPTVRRIVTISQLDRRLLTEYYRVPQDQIRTIYNGVDTDLFHPRSKDFSPQIRRQCGIECDIPLLVFASMDFEGKGLRTILQAMHHMQDRDARLIVLGQGPVRRFAAIARRLGLAGRVTFVGRVSNIERFYGAGDLLVLPTTYEPFPNVVLEALASGLPVLTTATAGGADVIDDGKNGYVISHSAAADEMTQQFDHHFSLSAGHRATMSQDCRAKVQAMTIENNARQIAAVFEEVLLEKSRV